MDVIARLRQGAIHSMIWIACAPLRRWRELLVLTVTAVAVAFFYATPRSPRDRDLGELIELHALMSRGERNPQARIRDLPRLKALFGRYPDMLQRYGGEFLQSAHFLALSNGEQDPWVEERLVASSQIWQRSADQTMRPFEVATEGALLGDWSSVAHGDDAPDALPLEWRHYALLRRLAAAELSGHFELVARLRGGLQRQLANGGVSTSREPIGGLGSIKELYSALRIGSVSLLDWVRADNSRAHSP